MSRPLLRAALEWLWTVSCDGNEMTTLLVPCAGRSTRFPDMRPKWLLTHPDGHLMVDKALAGCKPDRFDRIVFVITKAHDDEFEAAEILRQAFSRYGDRLHIVVLPDFTSGQAETVSEAIKAAEISGPLLVKDSDNFLAWDDHDDVLNFVVVGNLGHLRDTTNVAAKSYVLLDKNDIVQDIVEKRIISATFCAGAYQFASAEAFQQAFADMSSNAGLEKETYVSHVIAWMMARQGQIFRGYEATGYEDWGTLREWRARQKRFSTLFCDLDGVLVKNVGQYGSRRWENSLEPILKNLQSLKTAQDKGAQIVIITARSPEFQGRITDLLKSHGVNPHAVLTGCRHGHRVMINDYAATNPYPSCSAVSIQRDTLLAPYLQDYL